MLDFTGGRGCQSLTLEQTGGERASLELRQGVRKAVGREAEMFEKNMEQTAVIFLVKEEMKTKGRK